MKYFARALALLLALTFILPNSAIAASSKKNGAFKTTLYKIFGSKKKKKKVLKSKRRRATKYSKRSKSRRRVKISKAKARRIAKARARRAKANSRKARARRVAAAKRKALYSRKTVSYRTREKRGTIIIETRTRHLYHILGNGKATRYGVAVGKEGFSWSGTSKIRRKVKWPTWTPPKEMIERKPSLAKYKDGQPGGPANPLGAAAVYLFQGKKDTLYRIHGTNNPRSIGRAASSGCIRMNNKDIQHLYARVGNGTKVIVN